jgi:hypothetical protein
MKYKSSRKLNARGTPLSFEHSGVPKTGGKKA